MTDRQIQAVAEAIFEELKKPHMYETTAISRAAQAAIEASDAKYVPILVDALRKIAEARHPTSNGDVFASYSELRQYACEALAQLPDYLTAAKGE